MDAKCALCRKCIGAAFQCVPVFMCGASAGRFLVIGQNPSSATPIQKDELYLFSLINNHLKNSNSSDVSISDDKWIRLLHQYEFGISYGRKRLDSIFGEEWLESGKYAYTNAVRCRTPEKVSPSTEMIENCRKFTTHLIYGRDAVFFIGTVARSQYFSEDPDKDWVIDPKLGLCVFIKHYSHWQFNKVEKYQELVKRAIAGELK